MRAEFACPLSTKTLDGVEGDFEASELWESVQARSTERQHHPRPAVDHVPGCCPVRQELCPHRLRDRPSEIFNRYLSQRLLDVSVGDEVERDIDVASISAFVSWFENKRLSSLVICK
jgi:hypothetical protein